jgi:hypothetical protein
VLAGVGLIGTGVAPADGGFDPLLSHGTLQCGVQVIQQLLQLAIPEMIQAFGDHAEHFGPTLCMHSNPCVEAMKSCAVRFARQLCRLGLGGINAGSQCALPPGHERRPPPSAANRTPWRGPRGAGAQR